MGENVARRFAAIDFLRIFTHINAFEFTIITRVAWLGFYRIPTFNAVILRIFLTITAIFKLFAARGILLDIHFIATGHRAHFQARITRFIVNLAAKRIIRIRNDACWCAMTILRCFPFCASTIGIIV